MIFDQDDAIAIARKLEAVIEEGRDHILVKFPSAENPIVKFGIRRASKPKGHDYISRQMFWAQMKCKKFRECSISLAQYKDHLRSLGKLEEES